MNKRTIFSIICLCLIALTPSFAQRQNRANRGNQPRTEQRQHRSPRNFDMVVDTAVINQMHLPAKMVNQITALQASKQTAMKDLMQNLRNMQQSGDTEDAMNQMAAFKSEYRQQLRQIMGDNVYIIYLQLYIDRKPTGIPQFSEGRNNSNSRSMNQGGFPQNRRGGFGDDNGFGGGFGDE